MLFQESGLPAGTRWYLNLTENAPVNSTGSAVLLNLTNGTYEYFVESSNRTYEGAVEAINFVVNGAGPVLPATFVKTTYRVTLTESGLAPGAIWFVTVDTVQQYSNTANLVFLEPNGTHYFRVSSVSGYASAHDSGSFGVYGNPTTVYVSFIALSTVPSPFAFGPIDYLLLAMDVAVVVLGTVAVVNIRRRSKEPPRAELYRGEPVPHRGTGPGNGGFGGPGGGTP